ncbi:MAG TPA: FAD-binding oxidoreductase [Actinomycetes bacterium]|jgi:glycine/D-amino acid oxidase-like deaminating enzyme|nr:FAD-binding oxidoreductase [Actinomycetes bacterium]
MHQPAARLTVVVGGGIAGSSIALALADRGAPVVLVTRDPVDSASALSFGSISALGEQPPAYHRLACAGMAAWHRWARRLEGHAPVGFRRGGTLQWASTPAQGRLLAEQLDQARRAGYPVRPISRDELARLLPAARIGPVSAACHAEADAQVDVSAVLAAAHAALRAAGGRILLGAEGHVRVDDDGVLVEAGDERLRPAMVVLAAGAESAALAGVLGLDLPTAPSPGLLVRTAPVAPIAGGVVRMPGGPGPDVFLRQFASGAVLLGEGWREQVARDPTILHAKALLAQAARFFPALAGVEIERMTLGWRAMPLDHVPIVGPVAGLPSLYMAVPRGGVTIAPVLGELVAAEVLDGTVDELLVPLRPDRFAERAVEVMLDVETILGTGPTN